MVAAPLDFYFDFSSPYSYFAAEKIDALAGDFGRTVNWHPLLLGIVFQRLGTLPLVRQPGQERYAPHDMARSARFLGLPFSMPTRFPLPTQVAARAFYWLDGRNGALARQFGHAVFRAYYVDDRDISNPETVIDIAVGCGVDRDTLSTAVAAPDLKERLKQETETAIAQGVFGAPWVTVDGESFWGADRLPQIEKWLETGGF
jgi:2-hydroxychromene-2-carboxylate isomerase